MEGIQRLLLESCPNYRVIMESSTDHDQIDSNVDIKHNHSNKKGTTTRTRVFVTPDPIDAAALSSFVADDAAGAIATFVGTTRDSFQGKRTLRLEYEAYEPMAIKALQVRRWREKMSNFSTWLSIRFG